MKGQFDTAAFKEKLEAHTTFPALYMFKFIVPKAQQDELAALLPNNAVQFKQSSGGTYVSATIEAMMPNSDAIIAVYEKAAKINGVIAL
jgi:uncharacterized protein